MPAHPDHEAALAPGAHGAACSRRHGKQRASDPFVNRAELRAHRSRGICVCVCMCACSLLHACIIKETLMPVIGRKSCTRPTYQPLLAVRDSLSGGWRFPCTTTTTTNPPAFTHTPTGALSHTHTHTPPFVSQRRGLLWPASPLSQTGGVCVRARVCR